jgi:hypothetical protein
MDTEMKIEAKINLMAVALKDQVEPEVAAFCPQPKQQQKASRIPKQSQRQSTKFQPSQQ